MPLNLINFSLITIEIDYNSMLLKTFHANPHTITTQNERITILLFCEYFHIALNHRNKKCNFFLDFLSLSKRTNTLYINFFIYFEKITSEQNSF